MREGKRNSISSRRVQDWLRILYPEKGQGFLEVRLIRAPKAAEKRGKKSEQHWFRSPDSFLKAVPALLKQAEEEVLEVYVGAGLRAKRSGKKEDVEWLWCLWVDMDFRDTPEATARRVVRDTLPLVGLSPTAVVKTGHGVHLWWALSEGLHVSEPKEREKAEDLLRRIQAICQGDAVWNVDRIMRIPGSMNRKDPENPVLCEIAEIVTDRQYELDQFLTLPEISKPAIKEDTGKWGIIDLGNLTDDEKQIVSKSPYLKRVWNQPESEYKNDRSRRDFRFAIGCLKKRLARQSTARLLWELPGGKGKSENRPDYIKRTILRAEEKIREVIKERERKPEIIANNRDPEDIMLESWNAIHEHNQDAKAFLFAGSLSRVHDLDPARARIEMLGEVGAMGMMMRAARFVKRKIGPDDEIINTLINPPRIVAQDLVVNPDPTLPELIGIAGFPYISSRKTVVTKPGYDSVEKLFMVNSGPKIKEPPTNPSDAEISNSIDLIDELLFDFPFARPSDRAHAMALLLLPFVRPMIDGPTPATLIDSPRVGTGKSLLAGQVAAIALGQKLQPTTIGRDEEETRKKITSLLARGATLICIDNVSRRMNSESLAAVLTTSVWEDRLLGKTQTLILPNRATWILTGNNVAMSIELGRRCVCVRLDSGTEKPWERTNFKHDLPKWAFSNRKRLMNALLTMAMSWVSSGSKPGDKCLGGYESWSTTIGGILERCGIGSFLDNRDEFLATTDTDEGEWFEFVASWANQFGEEAVSTQQLWELASKGTLLGSVVDMSKGDSRSQRIKLGKALAKRRDQIWNGLKIIRRPTRHARGTSYLLVPQKSKHTAQLKDPDGNPVVW